MIDHSGHPHPSTPKARALCRANGGTGSTASPGKSAPAAAPKAKTVSKPRVIQDAATGLPITREQAAAKMFGTEVAKLKKPRSPKLTENRVPVPRKKADLRAEYNGLSKAAKQTYDIIKEDGNVPAGYQYKSPKSGKSIYLNTLAGLEKKGLVRIEMTGPYTGVLKAVPFNDPASPASGTSSARVKGNTQKSEDIKVDAKAQADADRSAREALRKPAMTTQRHDSVMSKSDDEEGQAEGLEAAPVGFGDDDEDRGFASDAERQAATRYIREGYGFINSFLRGQSSGSDKTQDDIRQLDAIMERSKLSEDVGVFRGVDRGRVLFGDSLDGDMTGLEWREKGYSSSSVNEDVADDFTTGDGDDDDDDDEDGGGGGGDSRPVKMRIVLPKGSSAFQASGIDDEAELILPRNSAFRVVKDRGQDSFGVRVIDVELIP